MLHLIPAPLHRVLYRLAHRARASWWRVRRPSGASVAVLALDSAGKCLLVRHSYGSRQWMVPGGGMRRNEDAHAAAMREFREELSCDIVDVREVTATAQYIPGTPNRQHLFAARLAGSPVPDRREIIEAELFDPLSLPPGTSKLTRWWIAQWLQQR